MLQKRRIVMKRTLAMFLALILALSLVACGGNNTTGNDTARGTTPLPTTPPEMTPPPTTPPAARLPRWPTRTSPWSGSTASPPTAPPASWTMAALSFNEDTYYVGFDANQGAELQGQMIRDYIEANIDDIDRNGDGVIGYVLAIGDIGHNRLHRPYPRRPRRSGQPALRWTAPSTAILWAPTPTAPPPSCRTAPWRSTAPPLHRP